MDKKNWIWDLGIEIWDLGFKIWDLKIQVLYRVLNDCIKIIADKLPGYLQHYLSLEELVNWAENALIEAHFEDDNSHTIRNILTHIRLSDVKAFGLEWKNCGIIMEKPGFKLEVNALARG